MPVSVRKTYVLIHNDGSVYTFAPLTDGVMVRHSEGERKSEVTVSVEEARTLWTRCIKRGYKRRWHS